MRVDREWKPLKLLLEGKMIWADAAAKHKGISFSVSDATEATREGLESAMASHGGLGGFQIGEGVLACPFRKNVGV